MVKRERYLQRIRPFYDSEMVKVITGIRRCGKSTLMQQIITEMKQQNIADDHIIYSTFPADISKQSLYKCGLRIHPFGHFTFNAGCDIC